MTALHNITEFLDRNKDRITVVIVIIVLFVFCSMLTGITLADETSLNGNGSINSGYTIPSYPALNATWPVYNQTPQPIQNGQCVAINSTVDISSLGWGVPEISYYGTWYDGFSAENISDEYDVPLPNTAPALMNFYIDPAIFASRPGYWYQNYEVWKIPNPNGYYYNAEASANDRMFWVNTTCPIASGNFTGITITKIITTAEVPELKGWLPEKKSSDVLIARGDSATINESASLLWWMFGYSAGGIIRNQSNLYSNVTVLDSSGWTIPLGDYNLDLIRPGSNSIFEELYNATTDSLVSPFANIQPVSFAGLNPQNAEGIVEGRVHSSLDDSVETLHLQLMNPEIDINTIDALQTSDNSTLYDIRGYTNLANNTQLTVIFDKGQYFARQQKEWQTTVDTVSPDPGVWREYNTLIPVNYNEVFPGFHNITVEAADGASISVQVYIYQTPEPNYIPTQSYQYTGINPYITPVTVIQTVMVPPVIQTVTVPVTPSDEQVKAQQEIIQNEHEQYWEGIGILVAILFLFLYIIYRLIRWIISIIKRARNIDV